MQLRREGRGEKGCEKNQLLEEQRSHLTQRATPGEELVGGALRDEAVGIEAGSLQSIHRALDAVGVLL